MLIDYYSCDDDAAAGRQQADSPTRLKATHIFIHKYICSCTYIHTQHIKEMWWLTLNADKWLEVYFDVGVGIYVFFIRNSRRRLALLVQDLVIYKPNDR